MDLTDAKPGDLIAFQIEAGEGFISPNEGKWGVLKVLCRNEAGEAVISVLQGVHAVRPVPADVRGVPVLVERRFGKLKGPLIFEVDGDWSRPLPSALTIGCETGFRDEENAALSGLKDGSGRRRTGGLGLASTTLDHEDRALHDRAAWLAEVEALRQKVFERAASVAKRQKERLESLTLAQLRSEPLLPDWDDRLEFLPSEFVKATRNHTQVLLSDLADLGAKPRRPAVRKLLRGFIEGLNALDKDARRVIETEEREELWQLIEDICWATRQQPLLEELDAWREW